MRYATVHTIIGHDNFYFDIRGPFLHASKKSFCSFSVGNTPSYWLPCVVRECYTLLHIAMVTLAVMVWCNAGDKLVSVCISAMS